MIIKSIGGGTLSLGKDKLTERTGGHGKYYLNLVELKTNEEVKVRQVPKTYKADLMDADVYHGFSSSHQKYRIGCRFFTAKVYKQIMAAAKKAEERQNGKSK